MGLKQLQDMTYIAILAYTLLLNCLPFSVLSATSRPDLPWGDASLALYTIPNSPAWKNDKSQQIKVPTYASNIQMCYIP